MKPLYLLLGLLSLVAAGRPALAGDSRLLLRFEGREESYGLLCRPQHVLVYYAVELLGDGALRAAIDGFPGTEDRAGAPTFQFFSGRIDGAQLESFRQLLAEVRTGRQTSCELEPHTPFFLFASASAAPVQRLNWFGKAPRRNAFQLDQGPECPEPVLESASRLRDALRALIAADGAGSGLR